MGCIISVIIPVYNREKTITIALDSVLKQTFRDFEVIIVDDGSIDSTSKFIKKYCESDERFKYFYQQNAGVAVARNKGIMESKGEYIAFLDSDDYYESTFLEKMYHTIKLNDSEICYCGSYRVTPNKRKKKSTKFITGNILKEYLLETVFVCTNGWLIKKEMLMENKIMFLEGVSWGEDVEFFCQALATTNKICCVKDYLLNFTVGFDNNNLSTFSIEKIDKDFASINRIIEKIAMNKPIIIKALVKYRLSAVITYRLYRAFDNNENPKVILDYFERYKKFIINFNFFNGLRSCKLNVYKLLLLFKIYRIKYNKASINTTI